jgi:Reverse transcriptase (RNA-dependent DNA polymerase)
VYLIIYVDNILVLTKSMKAILGVKEQLSKMYTVKDLSGAEYFLGVKIERESSTVKLTQTSYVKGVLGRFGMLECKPAQTPMSDPVSLIIKQPRGDRISFISCGENSTGHRCRRQHPVKARAGAASSSLGRREAHSSIPQGFYDAGSTV